MEDTLLGVRRHEAAASRGTKLALIGVFLTSMAAFSRQVRRERDVTVAPLDLLMLGLSSYRVGHMVAYEGVAHPLREPFTETRPDDTGAGLTVVARGRGARRALGELFSCPICFSTWAAAILVYGLHLAPHPTRVFLAVMSTTGLAELLYGLTESLTWTARAMRKRAGE